MGLIGPGGTAGDAGDAADITNVPTGRAEFAHN
jgi:hypothetical protein